jgi:hypothetical protein
MNLGVVKACELILSKFLGPLRRHRLLGSSLYLHLSVGP